jgi:hypothetical protein
VGTNLNVSRGPFIRYVEYLSIWKLSNWIFNALQFIELEKETKGLNCGVYIYRLFIWMRFNFSLYELEDVNLISTLILSFTSVFKLDVGKNLPTRVPAPKSSILVIFLRVWVQKMIYPCRVVCMLGFLKTPGTRPTPLKEKKIWKTP